MSNDNPPLFTYAAEVPLTHRTYHYARIDNSDYDNHPALLLFENKLPFKEWHRIAEDPLAAKILQYPYMMYRSNHNGYIVATADIEKGFLESFMEGSPPHNVVVQGPDTIPHFDGPEVFLQCVHPHKHIIQCAECIAKVPIGDATCDAKAFIVCREESPEVPLDMEETRDLLVNRRTKIGPFTMISPVLTADKAVASSYRPIRYHNFEHVEENSELRKLAYKERQRFKLFKQQACPVCMVKAECGYLDYGTGNWARRGCSGHYEGTEHAVARRILKQVDIPYTGKQLMFLLRNAGALHKRYNRCNYVLTFKIQHLKGKYTLVHGLNRTTRPGEFTRIPTFKESVAFIENYRDTPPLQTTQTLSTIQKAALVELVYQDYSPTRQAGWRNTSYPTLDTSYTGFNKLVQRYSYGGRETLPWTVVINSLKEFYSHFTTLTFVGKMRSTYAHRYSRS